MKTRAQTLIISLWILVILTILAVGIGHRVSMALRLSRYQRDRLKSTYLAKSGMNLAIAELNKDIEAYDSLADTWVDNEGLFGKILEDENKNEFAQVSYVTVDEYKKTIFGAVDEERKININTASYETLVSLFEAHSILNASELSNNIQAWRGDTDTKIPATGKNYEELGYPCKADKFSNIEELILVKDITPEIFNSVKASITVYGEGKVNINTVASKILSILAHAVAKKLSIKEDFVENLVTKIIETRDNAGYFKDTADIQNKVKPKLTGQEELNIFNGLISNISFKSDNFLIEANGNTGKIKKRLIGIYDRKNKAIIYWHES